MNETLCREHLAELVREELGLLGQLLAVLEQERQAIASTELGPLQRTTERRQQCVASLARTEEQRRSLCRLHGHTADAAGLAKLLKWCDPQRTLASVLRECHDLARKCRDLNELNAALVAAHLKRVDQRLRALRGRTDRSATYGPRGDVAASHDGRILGAV
ncbi:MAG: flagellar protein FlgN [Proteobacteria bacterium]|nr:flagellar protein FlgN [Pseudomonadota bacterium]